MRNDRYKNLFYDQSKLDSFVNNALTPLVEGLKNEPGLGAWEIMNEPEGSVKLSTTVDGEPCFTTSDVLEGSEAGWAGQNVSMQQLQYFTNIQTAAIHDADPKSLVTLGAWSLYTITDVDLNPSRKFRNYWKDECLIKAGGKSNGTLDFFEVHTYNTDMGAPFETNAGAYGLDRPLVIGEFASNKSESTHSITTEYQYAFDNGYNGVWDWSLLGGDGNDDMTIADQGMNQLKGNSKVVVDILQGATPPEDTCTCSDVAPDSKYTCVQQAGYGKCGVDFMIGYCCMTCNYCLGCNSIPASNLFLNFL